MATMVNRATTARKAQARPSFHLWMTLAMAAFVFTGFGISYIGPMAAGTFRPSPPIVHLHGAVFFTWILLLVTQSALVNVRNVKLHRSLGMFGIAVGTLVALFGATMQIVAASVTTLKGAGPGIFFLGFVAPPSFAILFVMAIRAVRTPEIHRNLILIATISVLMPAINRVYMKGVGLPYVPFFLTYLTMDVLLALVLWHERQTTGRISRNTWIGAAIVFVPQLFLKLVSSQPWWADVVHFMGSLVYYR